MLSVDDFALRRGRRYATLLLDAVTHKRIDVLPDRRAGTLGDWLRAHPGVEIVCRDGSAAYAEAIRQGAPAAEQVSDRWHLWHGLGKAVEKTVIAHSSSWRTPAPGSPSGPVRVIDERTRTRHTAVHELLRQGVGLLECARRVGWAAGVGAEHGQALRPRRDRRAAPTPTPLRAHAGRSLP